MMNLQNSKNAYNSLQNVITIRQQKISIIITLHESISNAPDILHDKIEVSVAKNNELSFILKQINDTINSQKQQLENSINEISNKEESLKQMDQNIESLKTKINQEKENIKQLAKDLENEKAGTVDKIKEKEAFNIKCQVLTENLKVINNQMHEEAQRIASLLNAIEHENNQIMSNEEAIVNIKNDITLMNSNLDQLDITASQLKQSISEKNNAHLSTHKEAIDFERSSIPLRQKLADETKNFDNVKSMIEKSTQIQSELSEEIENLKKQINAIKADCSSNESKLQNVVMDQARLKGESQAMIHRANDADKNYYRMDSERKMATDELEQTKNNDMELKAKLVSKMGDAQRIFSEDDTMIRQLTTEINEIRVKIDFAKNKRKSSKLLQKHIKKTEEEIHSISSQLQNEVQKSYQKPVQQSILPTLPNAKKSRGRILQLD